MATAAELIRFVSELENIRTAHRVARDALAAARTQEDAAAEAGDRRGELAALELVVKHTATTFEVYDKLLALAVEVDAKTTLRERLELLAGDPALESEFVPWRGGLIALIEAGVDSTEDALGALDRCRRWGRDPGVRECAAEAVAARDSLRARLAAEARGSHEVVGPGTLQ
jgi:hypothetical protein